MSDEHDYKIYNAKGRELPFDVEYYAYLVRAMTGADSIPVSVSNRLSKFGFIAFSHYAPGGMIKDAQKFDKSIVTHQEPIFYLTIKGIESLIFYRSQFSEHKINRAIQRQRY
jgi:hypothetical protein